MTSTATERQCDIDGLMEKYTKSELAAIVRDNEELLYRIEIHLPVSLEEWLEDQDARP